MGVVTVLHVRYNAHRGIAERHTEGTLTVTKRTGTALMDGTALRLVRQLWDCSYGLLSGTALMDGTAQTVWDSFLGLFLDRSVCQALSASGHFVCVCYCMILCVIESVGHRRQRMIESV